MSKKSEFEIIADSGRIAEIADRLAAAGRFAMDLEFVSADRYVPDLALVQLCWEEEGKQEMVLLESVGTELAPVFEQIESQEVLTVAHGAKQDLSLLANRYELRAGAFMDTQIAAAFAGIAEQIGYANLVDRVLGKKLDKGPQFTDWLRRPLSERQLRYALDDVRYLLPIWDQLRARLERHERRAWAQEETDALVSLVAQRRPVEEAYKGIGGGSSLKGAALAALVELAAWREELALRENIPPSWIIPDGAAVEACRRNLRREQDFRKLRGMGGSAVRKYGAEILAAIAAGRERGAPEAPAKKPLESPAQAQTQVVTAMVAGRASEIGIAQRALAAKADAEALVRHAMGQEPASSCKLLQGWRAQVLGEAALAWLRGEAQVVADSKYGVRVVVP